MSPERESSTSVLSGDDWRAIDRLVRSTAADSNSIQCRKLRSSLHHISVQNQMLQVEVDGLRDVIGTKKRHNKKSKPLDLQQHQEYHGGAVFWSPRALKEARWRERVRQQEERAEELQRVETKELKKSARLYKEKIIAKKRVAREKERAVKAEVLAEQRAAKQAEKDARNTIKALQLSQKGKRKASRAPIGKNKRSKSGGQTIGFTEAVSAILAAPTRTTRTGRTTRLPRKFK